MTNRFLVKRNSPYNYSAHPTLEVWIQLKEVSAEKSFASETEAYAAIGRYALKIVTLLGTDVLFTGDRCVGYLDLKVVEITPPSPAPTEWSEV